MCLVIDELFIFVIWITMSDEAEATDNGYYCDRYYMHNRICIVVRIDIKMFFFIGAFVGTFVCTTIVGTINALL